MVKKNWQEELLKGRAQAFISGVVLFPPDDQVLIVDLDSKDFYTVVGDEETIIPKKLGLALERALTEISSFSMVDANGLEDELSSDGE